MKTPLSYVDGRSFLHKADPRVKIISLMILSVLIFQTPYIWSLFFILILFFAVAALCRISFKRCYFAVRPLLFFVGMLFLFQFLFTPTPIFSDAAGTVDYVSERLPYEVGSTAGSGAGSRLGDWIGGWFGDRVGGRLGDGVGGWFGDRVGGRLGDGVGGQFGDWVGGWLDGIKTYRLQIWDFLSLSPDIYSFVSGIGLALKFLLLILFSSLMILTTKQSGLIQGIEKIVQPLPWKWVNLTPSDVALMALLMVQFIPLLLAAAFQTMDLARSRAFVFSKHPIKGMKLIAFGLMRSVMSFSDVVSMAMKNRGYTGVGRTHLHELKIQKRDIVFFGGFLLAVSAVYVMAAYLSANVFAI